MSRGVLGLAWYTLVELEQLRNELIPGPVGGVKRLFGAKAKPNYSELLARVQHNEAVLDHCLRHLAAEGVGTQRDVVQLIALGYGMAIRLRVLVGYYGKLRTYDMDYASQRLTELRHMEAQSIAMRSAAQRLASIAHTSTAEVAAAMNDVPDELVLFHMNTEPHDIPAPPAA